MAVSRLKTWVAGEILSASDLNAEFNNILNNGADLANPLTKNLDLDANSLILDADADSSITADTDDRIDFATGGFDAFRIDGTTASIVNGLDIVAAATGVAPGLQARGEADIGLELRDSNGNELLTIDAVASAVNELAITNQVASSPPSLSATGDDTNIGIDLLPKGAGAVRITSTEADATAGPGLVLYRNSASPAANDVLGIIRFRGEDDGGADQQYGSIFAELLDATAGSEDGRIGFNTIVAGSFGDRFNIGAGLYADALSDQGDGTVNATGLFVNDVNVGTFELETEVDATNGGANDLTEIDFTGIASSVKRITITFEAVSLTGTDDLLVQIGDSGGFETSGYVSTGAQLAAAGTTVVSSTSGFILSVASAGKIVSGHMVLTLSDSANNTWIASHAAKNVTGAVNAGGGDKSLSAVLTQVRITRTGTDTFDGGALNILTE